MKWIGPVSLACFFALGGIAAAQQPSCEENVEVLKLVYATARGNAEIYLEQLARGKVQADQMKVKLDEALKKIKEMEEAKLAVETKPE